MRRSASWRYNSAVSKLLVLGSPAMRELLARRLEHLAGTEVVDCDPALGDCVMYVRLEAVRYDGFFFAGFDHPVTRGALPIVADRAVLIPLIEQRLPDPSCDGYLFRLPKAIGYREESERAIALSAVPKASAVPSYLIRPDATDTGALSTLAQLARAGSWQWDDFTKRVRREADA